jgi:ATP-dependent DNA helicase RecG
MKFRESETLELKRSSSELKEAVISVVAMLNKHRRGRLYFGVRNDGEVVGQTVSDQTVRDVSRALSEKVEPRIYPKVERIHLQGKACLRVEFSGNESPYFAFGRAYIRIGDEDRLLSAKELERMFLARNRDASRWEAELSDKRVSDVDPRVIRRFVKKANLAGRIDFEFANVRNTLNKLDLVQDGKLLRAAEVLFCDDNPLEVQAAVFAGTDKRTFLDIKQFRGSLFDLLEKSETYVKEHINWKVEFGKLERSEIPEIPVDALREALVNSLCHRDYRNPKGNEIAVFKDRVEIYNPGSFPEGLTPEDFIEGGERSVLRNPRIAEALFKSKDIEKWGSGLKRISDECAERSVKVEFRALKTGFLVTFFRGPELGETSPRKTPQVTPQKTPQMILTGLESKILEAIAKQPGASRIWLAKSFGIGADTVKEYIERLKKKGMLRRVGPDRGGHWEVVL